MNSKSGAPFFANACTKPTPVDTGGQHLKPLAPHRCSDLGRLFLTRGVVCSDPSRVGRLRRVRALCLYPSPERRSALCLATTSLFLPNMSRSLKLVPLPWSLNKWQFPATTHDAFWKLSPVERLAREDAFANLPPALQTVREGEFVEEAKQPPLYYLLSMAVLRGGKCITAGPCSRHAVVLDSAGIACHSSFVCSFQAVLGETHALSATILIASMPGLLIAISRVANDSLAIALFAVLTYALVRPEPWDSRARCYRNSTRPSPKKVIS